MSRKDYEAVARILRGERRDAQQEETRLVVERIARDFAALFGADNPHFDEVRFLAACEVGA